MKQQNEPVKKLKPGQAACLGCGKLLSYCGKPFTMDIQCPSCGAVNVYEESNHPTRIKVGELAKEHPGRTPFIR